MKCKRYILLLCSWFWVLSLCSQIPDSIVTVPEVIPPVDTILQARTLPDSTVADKKRGFIRDLFSKEDYPNPKKALILSLAIPGGGQIYNKRWWKLPFVFGGYALLIIAVDYNTSGYRAYRDAYIAELAGQEHAFSLSGLNSGDLRRIRDGYDKNRQLSYIGIFALHIIQTAEAFVDCHLKTFDVSDDLSLRISPKMDIGISGQAYLGMGFTFQFSD